MPDKNPPQKSDLPGEEPGRKEPIQIPELTEIDMLSGKIMELENALGQYRDQLLSKAAEFENYKRRVENENAGIVKFSTEVLILKLLPGLDDFERLLKAIKGAPDPSHASSRAGRAGEDAFRRGME